jgi:hypothetical protein
MALMQKEKKKNESSYNIIWFSLSLSLSLSSLENWYTYQGQVLYSIVFFLSIFLGLTATHL